MAQSPLTGLLSCGSNFFARLFSLAQSPRDVVDRKKWNRKQKSEVSIKKSVEY